MKPTVNFLKLAIIAASLCFANEAIANTPQEIAKRTSPSVVLLVMEDAHGQPIAMGSGFVVREGVVATNMHVIDGAARGYARLVSDRNKHDIQGIAAMDGARDIVLLAVESLQAAALPVGDSGNASVGDTVYAIGNPRGLEGTFSAGIISSVREVGDDYLLQITAPISPGSSGGPVVNTTGDVIGIAVATFRGGQNLNFAIPSRYLSELVQKNKEPIDFPKAAEARREKKEKSILAEMGGRTTEGVTGGQFIWDYKQTQIGYYSFSLRNHLREHVQNVLCLVVFYGADGQPVEVDLISHRDIVPAGLARRVTSKVDGSVQRLTTREGSETPRTLIEFRVLFFDIVEPDDPLREQGALDNEHEPDSDLAAGARRTRPPSLEDIESELRQLEENIAKIAAKLAPAGNGPDLIESRIEGEFEGWEGDTIFKLDNGQIWQQVTYGYTYTYKFRPKVWIIKTHGAYKMKVEGMSSTIFVKRLR